MKIQNSHLQQKMESISLWDIVLASQNFEDYYNLSSGKIDEATNLCDFSNDFIEKYFTLAEKSELFKSFPLDNLTNSRKIHLFVSYMIGKWLYHKFPSIKNSVDAITLKNTVKTVSNYDNSPIGRFSYIWFLMTIAHDFASPNETNPPDEDILELQFPNSKRKCVPSIYNKKNILLYYDYKLKTRKEHDHGILGGLRLYRIISRLFKDKQGEINSTRSWSLEILKKDLSIAIWGILSHNIWYAPQDNYKWCQLYHSHGLDNFIHPIPSASKVYLSKHPFLFLLLLVDYFEPSKQFEKEEIKEKESGNCVDKVQLSKKIMKILKETSLLYNFENGFIDLPVPQNPLDLSTFMNLKKVTSSSYYLV